MFVFHWTDERVDHIAQNGVSVEEFELTVNDPTDWDVSDSSGLPLARRWFGDCWVIAIYKLHSDHDVEPVTAFIRRHEPRKVDR